MKLNPIITSPLENDLYKWSMMNVAFKKFNNYKTTWCYKCRNEGMKFTPEMVTEIREQLDWYCENVRYTEDDIEYLHKTCPWLSEGFLNFLRFWKPNRNEIFVNENNIQAYNDCGLAIEAHGMWLNVSWYEIPILAIVSEVYFSFTYGVGAKDIEFQKRTIEKFSKFFDKDTYEDILTSEINDGSHHLAMISDNNDYLNLQSEQYKRSHPYCIGTFSDFGLRRRYSGAMQDWLIKYIVDQKIPGFVGTSNVYLAKKYGVKPIGSQAHEWYMAYQGNPKITKEYSNYYGMKDWVEEYQTRNGIALTDTLGTDLFLKDFDLTFANLFNGVRHDSGDPIEWGEQMIEHYIKLGIDPKTKTLLFSDSLNFEKATKIKKHFENRINVAFGIGTFLTNDVGVSPLNIVMKMTECNGFPVAKLSNDLGKVMTRNAEYVQHLTRCIEWRKRFDR